MFITFEGVEGSGKSTQIKKLAEFLKKRGHDVVLTREPGGTAIGDQIRKVLLDAQNAAMVPLCELFLYYAARSQHLEELILPATRQKKIVLCDRFVDATLAYQGFARGLDMKVLAQLNDIVVGAHKPDLTFLFDLPVDVGLSRAQGRAEKLEVDLREERFENEKMEFHEKVRQGYLSLAAHDPSRFYVLDATQGVDDLQGEIRSVVEKKLGE